MSDINTDLDKLKVPPEDDITLPDDLVDEPEAPKKKAVKPAVVIGGIVAASVLGVGGFMYMKKPKTTPQVETPVGPSGPVAVGAVSDLGTKPSDATTNPLIAAAVEDENNNKIKKDASAAAAGQPVVAIKPVTAFKTPEEELLTSGKPTGVTVSQGNEQLTSPITEPQRTTVNEEKPKEKKDISDILARIRASDDTEGADVSIPVDIQYRTAVEQSANNNTAPSSNATGAVQTSAGTINADIAAGELMYGELTTALDTRVAQTPVRVVIHGGKYDGAIAMGKMTNVQDEFMVLEFTMLTINKKTYPINAIAINPSDWDVKISDKVYSGNWKRAALLAGKGYIQSYGESYLSDNMSTTVSDGAIVQSRNGSLTPKARNAQALSGAMKTLDPFVQEYITKETKNYSQTFPGKEMALLFMAPVVFR